MRGFLPATSDWFAAAFAGPTPVQEAGWKRIAAGAHSLLIAPTGSGKTLAAFLFALDRVIADEAPGPGYRVLYVSPLKALAHDVERNLRAPIAGIALAARARGARLRLPEIDIRTGDSSPAERRRMLRAPGDILVTTPESLYLMLGSAMRDNLRGVGTVIVDEIHSLAPTKRGAHLALSLERLARLTEREPQRIGLSATARPPELVAAFLGGDRPVEIVDCSTRPDIDLVVSVPVTDMERPPAIATEGKRLRRGGESLLALAVRDEGSAERPGLWPSLLASLLETIDGHRSTIVFVNSRALCERLTQRLNDMAEARRRDELGLAEDESMTFEPLVLAHHGSMSQARRREVEDLLKRGRLRGLVATSSLELGIDMAAVDHVVMVESPGSVARGLQRIGRAGHGVGRTSRGTLLPKHRGDLLEATVVAAEMREGRIESLTIPELPLDVLAQQIVAQVAVAEMAADELLALCRRSRNYRELSRAMFDEVLDMLAGRYPSADFSELRPRLVWDRTSDRLRARRGAGMLALTSGGTIPDRGLFPVLVAPDGPRVGELDEEMVYETRVGQVVTLGASSWRVAAIEHDRVLVTSAGGEPGRLPFWKGDGPGRPVELGRAIGAFLRRIETLEPAAARSLLEEDYGLDERAAGNLLRYLDDQRAAAGALPHDRRLVVERFRDETGDWRIAILGPFGSRLFAPWALAVEQRLRAARELDLQVLWNDDGILLRFSDCDEPPALAELLPAPEELEDLVVEQLGSSSLYAALFRENAARALLLPRRRPGRRSALWAQRLRAQSLMTATRSYPGFPIALETCRQAMTEVFDLDRLRELLGALRSGAVAVHETETERPSPFARSLVLAFTAAWLYEGDAPAAETRVRALTLDRALLGELLGRDDLRRILDADAIEEVVAEAQGLAPTRQARDADDLHDLLRRLVALDRAEIAARCRPEVDPEALIATLLEERRALPLRIAGEERLVAIENAALVGAALGAVLPPGVPAALAGPVADALERLLAHHLRHRGPSSAREIARRYALPLAATQETLEELRRRDAVAAGEFLPGGNEREWVDPEMLRRLKSASLARARRAIEPVDGAVLTRFLLAWHRLDRPGRDLEQALIRLEGLPLSLRDLIDNLLPARLENFQLRELDALFSGGRFVFIAAGDAARGDLRLGIYRREKAALLAERPEIDEDALDRDERAVLAALRELGAAFFAELEARLEGLGRREIEEVIWRLVARGLVANDGLEALAARSRRGGRPGRGPSGRFFPVTRLWLREPGDTERLHARAFSLLERHGVLGRSSLAGEDLPGGFAALYPVLRALEEAGRIRRGLFVAGLGGAQFALPGAVDQLRAAREQGPGREALVVFATEPALPWGATLPWPETRSRSAGPRRIAGARVVLIGGRPVLFAAARGRQLVTFAAADDEELAVAARALHAALQGRAGRRFRIESIDDDPVADSPRAAVLVEAGFARESGALSAW